VNGPNRINLRAASESDEEFLRDLYSGTRQAELALLPWTLEAKVAFVDMQFAAQGKHYRAAYPNAEHSIVSVEGVPAGRFYVDRQEGQILIVDLTLLPRFHRQGIGQALVSNLQREAASSGKAVTGHVERWNPAQLFWQRMGFELVPRDEMYFRISWKSASVKRAAM
jgi:ribosomal protein S18 acetylase RimI-like enzyme